MPDSDVVITRRQRLLRRLGAPLLVGVILIGMVGACSNGDEGGDTERFCGEVDANVKALTKPAIRNGDDVGTLLELYRTIGDVAPLAIEDDWNALTSLYETASTVDASDPDSRQRVSELAFRTERSAVEVQRWLKDNCRVNLPVSTIVPHDVKVPVTTTTVTTSLPG